MVVAVKVGTNEPVVYPRYHQLTHSEDIVQVFKENITTFGTQGDKQYLAIPVDVSHLPEEEVDELILRLQMPWEEGERERLYYVATDKITWIIQEDLLFLRQQEYIRSSVKNEVYVYVAGYIDEHGAEPSAELVADFYDSMMRSFDISRLNDFGRFVTLESFAAVVYNKATGETLAQELEL